MNRGKTRNDGNGWLPRVYRKDSPPVPCWKCGEIIVWVKTAMRRIPYERREWARDVIDHRNLCRMRLAGRFHRAGEGQHRVTPVRRLSNRLVAALVRDGRSAYPGARRTPGLRRDESMPHMRASQAGESTTRRAASHAAPARSAWVH